MAAAAGLIFPLALRIAPRPDDSFARNIGGLYGFNTLGCIAGSLITGWILIPKLGTQWTVFVGGALGALIGIALLRTIRPSWTLRAAAVVAVSRLAAIFLLPRWDMGAITAGGYKYAEYTPDQSVFGRGEIAYLKEGVSGTVSVRKNRGSTILAIDGKVDATDAGGDLLTEKLLAHIPLSPCQEARNGLLDWISQRCDSWRSPDVSGPSARCARGFTGGRRSVAFFRCREWKAARTTNEQIW